MAEKGLNPRQQKALAALIAAPTVQEAARVAGCGRRTLDRWLSEPEFKAAYKAALNDYVTDAVRQARQGLNGAFSALADIAGDPDQPAGARVSAARATVELSLKLTEQIDILETLEELERWREQEVARYKGH